MSNNVSISNINNEQLPLFEALNEATNTLYNTSGNLVSNRNYLPLKQKYEGFSKIEKGLSNEEYMDIPNYEGHYQISNKGNVKSLKQNKETVLKPSIDKKGYYKVSLYKAGKGRKFYIHRVVIQAFKGEIPKDKNLVVDHINNDKTNNELINLQVISNRENLSKDKWRYNPTSFYTGVCYHKTKKKWESSISVNGDSFHLGYFNNESKAGLEYKRALEHYNQYSDLTTYSFKTKRRNVYSIDVNQLTINFIQPY